MFRQVGMGFVALRFGDPIVKGCSVPEWVVPVCCLYCVSTIQMHVTYTKDPRAEQPEILEKPAASLATRAWLEDLGREAHSVRWHRNVCEGELSCASPVLPGLCSRPGSRALNVCGDRYHRTVQGVWLTQATVPSLHCAHSPRWDENIIPHQRCFTWAQYFHFSRSWVSESQFQPSC